MTQYPVPHVPHDAVNPRFTFVPPGKARGEQYSLTTVQKLAVIANTAPDTIRQGSAYQWRAPHVQNGVKRGLWMATWESAEDNRLSGWEITGLTDLGYRVLKAWVAKHQNEQPKS